MQIFDSSFFKTNRDIASFCVFTEKWTINPIGLLENISTAIIDTSLLLCAFIPVSYTTSPSPRDRTRSRMPSSA